MTTTTIQTVFNEGAKSMFQRHVKVEFLPKVDKFLVEFSTTLDTTKNPGEHAKELQLFLTHDELTKLFYAVGNPSTAK